MPTKITYPYIPEGRTIHYKDESHPCMIIAKEVARKGSLDKTMPNGSILIKNGRIIGRGANGSNYHENSPCQRVALGCKTGEGYEFCEGCHPKNHGESKVIADALSHGEDPKRADLYLWGHWWCCKWCWDTMIKAEIRNVFLVKNSEVLFNKDHPENIIGKQFR